MKLENRLEWLKVYGIVRDATIRWEKAGTLIDNCAKRGWAISPNFYEALLEMVDIDHIETMPSKLTEMEKAYLRLAYSKPGGIICFPKPASGALKGYYYDEKREKWKPRPYLRIPG